MTYDDSFETGADPQGDWETLARRLFDCLGYEGARRLCDARRWPKVADEVELLHFRTLLRSRQARR